MKARFGFVVLGALILGASPIVKADPAGSSTAAGGANTTGLDLKITLSPGAVATRTFEANAQYSLNAHGKQSVQAGARLPVHTLNDTTETMRQGVLLDPGIKLRLDEAQSEHGGRTLIEGTGLGIYRWQGLNVHDTPKDRQNLQEAVERAKMNINRLVRATPVPQKPAKHSYRYGDESEYHKQIRARYEAAEPTLAKVDAEVLAILKTEGLAKDHASIPENIRAFTESVREGLESQPNGSNTRVLLLAGGGSDARIIINEPVNSEASGVGEIVLGHAGYRYDDNRELGTLQHGALLTPFQAAGHVAFRINRLVNVGFCGAVKPLEILAGDSEDVGLLSSSIEGCADITVGELPTVRNRFGTTYNYNMNGKPGGEHGDPNAALSYANSLTLEKKLGPVTPYVGWTLEHQQADRGANITNNWFTVGVAH